MPMQETATTGSGKPLSIIIVGASGDLAMKKVFPALFALYCQGLLPERFTLFGFSRSALSDTEFRNKVTERLTCRYRPGTACEDYTARFLSRCRYVSGQYASRDAFLDIYTKMRVEEGSGPADRVFYMAIPPFLFLDVARAIGDAGLVSCGPSPGWSRVVIEKPFGRDRESSDALVAGMGQVFAEEQTYRIDHYLGKEVIQNLLVLRFANLILEPVWNRSYVAHVHISWAEDLGVEGRGGYFDEYGIIRDVVQNHLLQILALTAMDPPAAFDAHHIRNEKVRVLRSVAPAPVADILLGQYGAGDYKGQRHAAYTEEPSIARDSVTPTYVATVLHVRNNRWDGVPFLLTAGKALSQRKTEIRVRFRDVAKNLFAASAPHVPANELVIRVQPDESISLQIVNKAPGLKMELAGTDLDLHYASAFKNVIPDAYECLLLDVLRGDRSLFIRADELEAAWDIFTPALHEMESARQRPERYPFGENGPGGLRELATRHGIMLDAIGNRK